MVAVVAVSCRGTRLLAAAIVRRVYLRGHCTGRRRRHLPGAGAKVVARRDGNAQLDAEDPHSFHFVEVSSLNVAQFCR